VHRGRTAAAAAFGLTALAGMAWLGAALADQAAPAPAPADALGPVERALAAGKHLRIDGPRGPIHVWIPPGYQPDTAATVLYVHGYWDTVDSAWAGHRLAEQFALGALNALVIAPEAPSGPRVPVNYPRLAELLQLVEAEAGVVRGAAWTVAIGHSGAYRTLESWLDEPVLDQLVMVDAQYGDEAPIVRWLTASDRRRLIMVGQDTVLGTESVASALGDVLTLDRFPPSYDTWPAEARDARVVYVRAQYGHMPLVTEGIVLPSLLRLVPVPRLPDLPWQLPLGPLPPPPDAARPDASVP